jgi:hypothetical protein
MTAKSQAAFRCFVGVITILLCISACTSQINTDIRVLKKGLTIGMDRSEIEAYLSSKGFEYDFSTREKVDRLTRPRFQWKSSDAVGLLAAAKRGYEPEGILWVHIIVSVEIDSQNKASQVIVEKAYTGP